MAGIPLGRGKVWRKRTQLPPARRIVSMSSKSLKAGDRVEWDTSQGKTTGKVKKKLTSPMKIKSHKVKASSENPQYLVETEKSKKKAAHKPSELRKKKS